MDPHGKFLAPTTDEEFNERSKDLKLDAVQSILSTLKERRKGLVANIDEEIAFYEKVEKKILDEIPF